MTTLTNFAPKSGWTFKTRAFSQTAITLSEKEKAHDIKFFEDSVRKGCYGNCEKLYRDNEICAMGWEFRPDVWTEILVKKSSDYDFGYVTRYLPGSQESYTKTQVDKWVKEFDGKGSCWCFKSEMRYV